MAFGTPSPFICFGMKEENTSDRGRRTQAYMSIERGFAHSRCLRFVFDFSNNKDVPDCFKSVQLARPVLLSDQLLPLDLELLGEASVGLPISGHISCVYMSEVRTAYPAMSATPQK